MRLTNASIGGRAATGLLLALVAAACSDALGPGEGLTVALTSPRTESRITDSAAGALLSCEFDVDARGKGKKNGSLTGAVLRLYAGPTRTEPIDTATFGALDMVQVYETLVFPPDYTKSTTLQASFPLPFELEYELMYTVGGRAKSAKVRMPCGPVLPAGGVQPPVLAPLAFTGNAALRPGDAVAVNVSATSNYGLWETHIKIEGPFTDSIRYLEHGATATLRTPQFIVPATAVPDVPIVATVVLIDAAGGSVLMDVATPKQVVDLAPPVLTAARFRYRDSWSSHDIGPHLSLDNLLAVELDATDDLGLRWLVLETDGPTPTRDSVAIIDGVPAGNGFGFRPQRVGARTASLHVVDRAGKRSANIVRSPTDSLNFYPYVARPRQSVATPGVSGQPVFDVARNRFYFPDGANARILVVDATTMSALAPIAIGSYANGLDLSIGGDSILAASQAASEIVIVDLRGPTPVVTRKQVRATPVGGSTPVVVYPGDVKQDMNGQWIVSAGSEINTADVLMRWEPTTGIGTWIARPAGSVEEPSYGASARLSRSADRSRMVSRESGCPRTYDATTGALGPCRTLASSWWSSAVTILSPNGDEISSDRVSYDRDLVPRAREWGRAALSTNMAYSEDGTTLWIAESVYLDRVRASDGRRLERTLSGVDSGNLWPSPDGNFVYVLSLDRQQFVRIDLR